MFIVGGLQCLIFLNFQIVTKDFCKNFFLFIGTWQCVKRKLPDSGRYDLESHLPVYLWKKYCDEQQRLLDQREEESSRRNQEQEKAPKQAVKHKADLDRAAEEQTALKQAAEYKAAWKNKLWLSKW